MASPAPSTEEDTQFIPLSDDEENLWTVIEITAERPRHYKVRWAGNDPATGRPWAQSWVPRTDCTDDLRQVWKNKQALKKQQKGKGKARSSKASTTFTPSTATVRPKSTHSNTVTPALGSRPPESKGRAPSKATVKPTRTPKRKYQPVETITSDHSDDEVVGEPEAGPSKPRKRFKLDAVVIANIPPVSARDSQESFDVDKRKKYGKVVKYDVDQFEEEAWGAAAVKPTKGKSSTGKAKARDRLNSSEEEEEEIQAQEAADIKPTKGKTSAENPKARERLDLREEEEEEEVQVREAAAVKLAKGKHNRNNKTRESLESHNEDDERPHHNLKTGPPRGAKKTKTYSMKPRSRPTPLATANNKPSSKPSLSKPRTQPDIPSYADAAFQSDRHSLAAEEEADEDNEVEAAASSDHGPDPLFLPEDDDPVDQNRPESSNLSEHHEDVAEPYRQPSYEAQIVETQFDLPSPEVQETQSQESNPQSGPVDINQSPPARRSSPSQRQITSSLSPSSQPAYKRPSSKLPADANLRNGKSKPLGSIPRVSPSTFLPYHRSSSSRLLTPEADNMEPEAPISSIEDFSPAKSKNKHADSIRTWGSSQRDPGEDLALRKRGEELARETQERRQMEIGKKTRRPLADLRRFHPAEPEKITEHGLEDDITMEDSIVQEMEDEFFDLSGGGQDQAPIPERLAQEEEESTQDLLRERQILTGELARINAQAQQEVHDLEQLASQVDPAAEEAQPTGTPVTSAEDTRIKGVPPRKEGTLEELPATLSPPRPSPNDLSRSQTEPVQSQTASLSQAMNLLHLKSEEIATLKAAQALNNTRLTESQVAVAALREGTAKAQSILSEAIKGFEAEKKVWEAERIALQASLAESTKATAEAEADRDFFRTQYAQASGFAGAVREENVELEQRVAIAEAQTKDGVYMIKATYVEQVKALQAEIVQANWRADLLRTQSARTDSEIRKKAGEYPGLLAQHEETLEECAMLNATIDELRRDRKALQAKLQRKAQQSFLGPTDDVVRLSNGSYPSQPSQVSDLVYRCQWRPGGDVNACLDVFDTHDDLERHMFSDEHLLVRARR